MESFRLGCTNIYLWWGLFRWACLFILNWEFHTDLLTFFPITSSERVWDFLVEYLRPLYLARYSLLQYLLLGNSCLAD